MRQLPRRRPRPTGTIRSSGATAPVTYGSPESWATSPFSSAHFGRRIERRPQLAPVFFVEVAHRADFITVTMPGTAPPFPRRSPPRASSGRRGVPDSIPLVGRRDQSGCSETPALRDRALEVWGEADLSTPGRDFNLSDRRSRRWGSRTAADAP